MNEVWDQVDPLLAVKHRSFLQVYYTIFGGSSQACLCRFLREIVSHNGLDRLPRLSLRIKAFIKAVKSFKLVR